MDKNDNSSQFSMPDRIVYLERKVQEQEIEIKHLRNVVDDLSRKVSSFFVVDPDSYSSCSLSKSLSRSYANLSSNRNLARPFSGSTLSIGRFSENNDLLVMSTYSSPSCIGNRSNFETNANQNGKFLTGKAGLPCRIYQKNANENGANGKTTENRVVKTKARSFSNIPAKNGLCLNLRAPPQFYAEENVWKFFIGHRCVNLYGPSSVDNEQSKNFNDDHKFSASFEGRDKSEQQQQGKENNKTKIRLEMIGNSAEEKKAKSLKVEWIYGYRGRDCRSNLHFLPTGELAYNLGMAVVLFNKEENCQRHFLDHTAEIKCLCMHPNRLLLASGQSKSHSHTVQNAENQNIISGVHSAHIRIWDSIKLKTVKILGTAHFEKFPCCLSFSKANGGVHLAAIEDTIDHPITIWDWQHGRKVAETKTGNEPVFALEFHPSDKSLLMSCGKNHVSFWNFHQDILHKKTTVYDPKDKPKYFLCVGFGNSGQIYTGDSNGTIYVWNSSTCKVSRQSSKSHDGPVFSLCQLKNCEKLLSGCGKDGVIMVWDSELNYQSSTKIPSSYGSIRTLTPWKGDQLAVGTTTNCILTGSVETTFVTVMQGHSDDITCLDIDPQREQFLTGSLDNHIRCWDVLSHSPVWSTRIEEHIESICYHPDGQSFLVGCGLGRWYALDLTTREILARKSDGCDPISCLSYSPNVQYLAIGSTNSNIYLYSCVGRHYEKYEKIGMCSGHTAPITNLDWASDSRFFRSNSEVLELIHWDAKTGKILTNSGDFRNLKWSTNSCVLSYDMAGAWLPEEAESQNTSLISSCDSKNHLLATYDSLCRVNLRPFPCFYGEIEQSISRRQAHCSRTGCLKFTPNSTRLISIGRKDLSLIQWSV